MKAVRRTAWYWGRVLGEVLLLGTAGSVCLTVISSLGSSEWNFDAAAQSASVSWVILSAMVMLIYTVGWFETYLPTLLALGCRRREAFFGMEAAKAVISLVIGLVGTAFVVLLNAERKNPGDMLQIWLTLGMLLCCTASVGEMIGGLYYKIGKIAMVGVGILFGVLGGLLGMAVASGVKQNMERFFDSMWVLKNNLWLIGLIGLAFFAASAALTWLLMRKAEVRM